MLLFSFFFSPLNFFFGFVSEVFRKKSPSLFVWIFTKTANKICDVIVQVGLYTSWVRSSEREFGQIKFPWNLPAGTVLAWGSSPPVQPQRAPSATSATSATVPGKPAWQRSRAVLCPWFNYNHLLPLFCPVLDSLHIVLEKLSRITAFVYIKYRMIEELATALFSFLSHAFLPKYSPLLLPDHCLNCV